MQVGELAGLLIGRLLHLWSDCRMGSRGEVGFLVKELTVVQFRVLLETVMIAIATGHTAPCSGLTPQGWWCLVLRLVDDGWHWLLKMGEWNRFENHI